MNGGKIPGLFGSLFGESILDRDCANILQDPNADPMDKDICQAFKEFSSGFPSIDSIVDREQDDGASDKEKEKPDSQSLRDSIFERSPPPKRERNRRRRSKGDEDLDSQIAQGADPRSLLDPQSDPVRDSQSFSSYTKVTVTTKSDGTVEETRTHRDSMGNEEETTIIREGTGSSDHKRPSIRSKLSDWVWPKH